MKKLKDVGNGYMLDNKATVYSIKKHRRYNPKGILREVKPKVMKTGYLYAHMYNDVDRPKKKMFYRLHRLVWETFVGQIPEGLEIHHKDHNKGNNALKNLALVTHKENLRLWQEWKKKQKGTM
jgi:hypothetical protein